MSLTAEIEHFPTQPAPILSSAIPTEFTKPLIYTSPVFEQKKSPCYNTSCTEDVSPDAAVWYNMGISHYNKHLGVSYLQVHTSPFCCSEQCATDFIHSRIDRHANFTHGEFSEELLNPLKEHPSAIIESNALYSPIGRAWASLPTIDALSGAPLGDDIYVPHLDRCSHQDPKRGTEGYHVITGELGTATLQDCVKLCHLLVDEILSPQSSYRKDVYA